MLCFMFSTEPNTEWSVGLFFFFLLNLEDPTNFIKSQSC